MLTILLIYCSSKGSSKTGKKMDDHMTRPTKGTINGRNVSENVSNPAFCGQFTTRRKASRSKRLCELVFWSMTRRSTKNRVGASFGTRLNGGVYSPIERSGEHRPIIVLVVAQVR